MTVWIILISLIICTKGNLHLDNTYHFETRWFEHMPVDHFSFTNTNLTFKLRYLVNTTHWSAGGPIFFYTGNEGDIEVFAQNTGFMWDIAPEFKAMLVFAEHRYYGKSMPFGNDSFKDTSRLGYLSSEQALADYAVLLTWLKQNITGAASSKVMAFGGSYGGMLAAWMRMKYPHIVLGAIAGSAPVRWFPGHTPCYKFSEIVTTVFKQSGTDCDWVVKKSWGAMKRLAKTSDGKSFLNEAFHFCNDSFVENDADLEELFGWITDSFGNLAMINYPYPTNFLTTVPGWPVKAACKKMSNAKGDDKLMVKQLYEGLSIYGNFSGNEKCYDFKSSPDGNLDAGGWDFQSCTEMVMPMCNNGTDMFYESAWNYTDFVKGCQKRYGVTPRPNWAIENYGTFDNLTATSNIVFSNGMLDPWHGGGVLVSPKIPSVISILVTDGAHHYDLRASNPQDTKSVLKVRTIEKTMIRKWLGVH